MVNAFFGRQKFFRLAFSLLVYTRLPIPSWLLPKKATRRYSYQCIGEVKML
jgi:hypothetical protein